MSIFDCSRRCRPQRSEEKEGDWQFDDEVLAEIDPEGFSKVQKARQVSDPVVLQEGVCVFVCMSEQIVQMSKLVAFCFVDVL